MSAPSSPSSEHTLIYAFATQIQPTASGALNLSWPAGENPFDSSRTVAGNEAVHTIRAQLGAFTPEECREAISCGESMPRMNGRVELGEGTYRVSHIAWILPDDRTRWMYHKLNVLFAQAAQYYGFELTGFVDPIQYTCYGPGQHFDWHMDLGPGSTSTRKLSISVQLSPPDTYTGGNLEFVGAPSVEQARQLGTATFFPSYIAHRVTEVSAGVRRSLVAWACGPAFR